MEIYYTILGSLWARHDLVANHDDMIPVGINGLDQCSDVYFCYRKVTG